ncbi:MAG: GNAT family protein [Candidatus Bipolaricaulota bacterium]
MALEGRLVILREEELADQKLFAALRNDLDTQAWGKSLPPDTTEAMYVKRFQAREFSFERNSARLAIVERASGRLAGVISYNDEAHRLSTSIGIMVAKEFWGTGVAFDAQEVLLRFLFQELGLREVHLWTHSGNPHAISLAERSGFAECTRLRESVFKNGRLLDAVIMSLPRDAYFARHPEESDRLPSIVTGEAREEKGRSA